MEILSILANGAIMAAPIILASLGGLASERSGVMNIALEGKMLAAAAAAAFVGSATGSIAAALFAGVAAALILSIVHWALTQAIQMDHIISGMAINALALGGTSFARELANESGPLKSPPGFQPWLLAAAALLIAACGPFLLSRTRAGLALRAVGEDPDRARESGLRPPLVRLAALAICGALCGLSGGFIALNSGVFVDGMTDGRGYIALAALILGRWRPLAAAGAGLVFGILESLQLAMQGRALGGVQLPSEAWQALPYLVGLLALAGILGYHRGPAGMGRT